MNSPGFADESPVAVDVDIDGPEENGRYHVYVETPYWGV